MLINISQKLVKTTFLAKPTIVMKMHRLLPVRKILSMEALEYQRLQGRLKEKVL